VSIFDDTAPLLALCRTRLAYQFSTTQRYMHLDDRELADVQDLVE